MQTGVVFPCRMLIFWIESLTRCFYRCVSAACLWSLSGFICIFCFSRSVLHCWCSKHFSYSYFTLVALRNRCTWTEWFLETGSFNHISFCHHLLALLCHSNLYDLLSSSKEDILTNVSVFFCVSIQTHWTTTDRSYRKF